MIMYWLETTDGKGRFINLHQIVELHPSDTGLYVTMSNNKSYIVDSAVFGTLIATIQANYKS